MTSQPTDGASSREAGFTLAELTVSLFVLIEVLLAALLLIDFNGKLARVQVQVTGMQQSMRAAQYELVRNLRMAGRGGLVKDSPSRPFPLGGAIDIRNDVGRGGRSKEVAVGFATTPTAVPGTDIVTLRGVFATPIYQVDSVVDEAFTLFDVANNPDPDPALAVRGVIHICNKTPLRIKQDLAHIEQALAGAGTPEALVLVSPIASSIYGVVELDRDNTVLDSVPCTKPDDPASTGITIAFRIRGGTHADSYRQLSPVAVGALGLPSALTSVAYLGILEEYRYYIREDYVVPTDPASQARPHLTQARMFPGTETPYGSTGAERSANLKVDIADGIVDLQAALALDTNGDGSIGAEGAAGAAAVADEWLYNDPGDDPAAPRWQNVAGVVPAQSSSLFYLRVSTLGRTLRRDPKYQAPILQAIEDRSYAGDPANTAGDRMFRRRVLQSIIDLRNL